MTGRVVVSAVVTVLILAVSSPAFAKKGRYWGFGGGSPSYEWSTKRPFSGFVSYGARTLYCDYIKYPKRRCYPQRVCNGGRCYSKQKCKFVGWDIRQTCR